MSSYMCSLLLLGAVLFWSWFIRRKLMSQSVRPLPPGPKGDPLIGNLRIMPRKYQPEIFYEWSKEYGDVMSLNVLGRPIIVLNSVRAVSDLLEKRSANYSDRPTFPMHELIGWSDNLAFLPYNDEWQKQRKLFQQQLSRKGALVFQNIQLRAATTLLNNLLRDPDMFDDHCRRYATSVIMEIAYGHEIVSDDDPYLQIAKEVNNVVTGAGDPGTTPPDLFPILKKLPSWFPGAWFIRYGRESRKVVHKVKEWPFREVIANMAAGTANPSFLSLTLEELAGEGNQDPEMVETAKVAAAHFYAAGGDTTYSTILIFFFAMLLHQDAQKKAQKEIDQVIGNRLPDFSDRASLPMVECVINEAIRWHQAGPLAIPHRTMEEDTYRGYRIPKGAVVIGNVRGITLDENVYTDPHCFYPERYLPRPAGNGEPYPTSMYGFGRRVCPGRHLADNSIWIVGATILASFEITFAKDGNGCDIVPPEEFTSGLTSHPKTFQCDILPRSTMVKNIAHQEVFHVQ